MTSPMDDGEFERHISRTTPPTPSVSDTVNAGLGSVGTSPSPTDGEGAVAPRIGFMCKVDFDYDIESSNGADVYPTIEMLRRRRRCVDECGIVKVEVRLLSVEQEEDFSAYLGPPSEHPVGEGFMPTEPNTSNPPPDKAVLGGMGEEDHSSRAVPLKTISEGWPTQQMMFAGSEAIVQQYCDNRDWETAKDAAENMDPEPIWKAMLAAAPALPQDVDGERCLACDKLFKVGDRYYLDASGGEIHADCCGPERESYTGPDGEPLGPNDPIPEPDIWGAETKEGGVS